MKICKRFSFLMISPFILFALQENIAKVGVYKVDLGFQHCDVCDSQNLDVGLVYEESIVQILISKNLNQPESFLSEQEFLDSRMWHPEGAFFQEGIIYSSDTSMENKLDIAEKRGVNVEDLEIRPFPEIIDAVILEPFSSEEFPEEPLVGRLKTIDQSMEVVISLPDYLSTHKVYDLYKEGKYLKIYFPDFGKVERGRIGFIYKDFDRSEYVLVSAEGQEQDGVNVGESVLHIKRDGVLFCDFIKKNFDVNLVEVFGCFDM